MKKILLTLFTMIAACGGGSAKPAPTTPVPDPIPMDERAAVAPTPVEAVPVEPMPDTQSATPADPARPEQPAAPDPAKVKAELLAVETAAYAKAKPVFEKFCASCHTQGKRRAKKKTLDHFDMTSYPFGGHHAMEISKEIREVLAIGGGKATMPKNKRGAVKGDDLALIAAWADAFDASHAGGAHEGHHGHGGGHEH